MPLTVLAMSGGVDSSVAASLLRDAGHEVVGVFMRHGSESPVATCTDPALPILAVPPGGSPATAPRRLDHKQGCCSASDAEDARMVADNLNIPFYALNLQREFDRIIAYFVDEYTSGRTPNPCVMCNNWIKFGKLFDYANSIGADFVATGHYARLLPTADGEQQLLRAVDGSKDQSYVLFGVSRKDLCRMLLPVGGYQKSEIRAMAANLGLRVAEKKDSQEICFVTSGDHGRFVASRSNVDGSGEIVTTNGDVVGHHDGIEKYTVGQRKGLGVAMGEPFFVVRIEPERKRVVIGRRDELARSRLQAKRANWLVSANASAFRCGAQIRYNSSAHAATVRLLEEGQFAVEFDEPCHGVAPGQAIVCYDGDRVLGGGWIE